MLTSTNLQDEIKQQISIGFTKQEVEENLLAKGYSAVEIKDVLGKTNFSQVAAESGDGSVTTKSILIGILFLVVAAIRFGRYIHGGGIFLGIGVITAIILAILYFTKRR